MHLFNLGETVFLELQLEDGNASQYPSAFVWMGGVFEIQVNLAHVASGRYVGTWTPLFPTQYGVTFIVYQDAPRTIINPKYAQSHETWREYDAMVDAIWDELMSGHTIPGSAGDLQAKAASVSSRQRVVHGYNYSPPPSVDPSGTDTLIGNAWLETDGNLDTNVTSCSISFYDSNGTLLFTETDVTPDAQSVFAISRVSPGFSAYQKVYIIASIVTPSNTVTTPKAMSILK